MRRREGDCKMLKTITGCLSFGQRISRRLGQRTFLKAFAISVVALCMYVFVVQVRKEEVLKKPFFTALMTIKKHAKIHPNDLDADGESTYADTFQEFKAFKLYMRELNSICPEEVKNIKCAEKSERKGGSLLTLFTTWVFDESKFHINNNTLYNWKLLPNVNVVVFSNCSKVRHYSTRSGWVVLPVIREAAGAPILTDMFQQVKDSFPSSTFYGYVNADILFTDQLLKTLEAVRCKQNLKDRVLIVGKRTNIPASILPRSVVLSWMGIEKLAHHHGTIFQPDAMDYFITDSQFPWKEYPLMPVGRRGYDNWVVAFARYRNFTTIDATDSLLALHQTLEERGNYEGLHKPDEYNNYNIEIVEKQNAPFLYGSWGQTVCADWHSWMNLCDQVEIQPRKTLRAVCTAMKGIFS